MKKQVLTVLVTAALAGGLVACNKNAADGGSQGAAGGDVIHIATGSPLSGGQANAGKDFVNGVQLAVEEINAAGGVEVGGKKYKLEVTSEDDAGDPKTGATVAQKTADDSSIVAVIGHYNSGVTMVAAPIYANAGIPSITVSTNPDVINKAPKLASGGTAVFRINAGDDKQGPALATFAQGKGVKNLVVLDDATAYGKGLADQVAKTLTANGAQVLTREAATDKTTDFKAVLTEIKGQNPDFIFWGGMDDTAATLVKQMKELGITARLVVADGSCTDKFVELAGAASKGSICSQIGMPLSKMPQGVQFNSAYEKTFPGQKVQLYSPFAYDATYAIVNAMKLADSTDREAIAAAMPKVHFDGVTGPIAFDDKGDIKHGTISIFQVDGKLEVADIVKD